MATPGLLILAFFRGPSSYVAAVWGRNVETEAEQSRKTVTGDTCTQVNLLIE